MSLFNKNNTFEDTLIMGSSVSSISIGIGVGILGPLIAVILVSLIFGLRGSSGFIRGSVHGGDAAKLIAIIGCILSGILSLLITIICHMIGITKEQRIQYCSMMNLIMFIALFSLTFFVESPNGPGRAKWTLIVDAIMFVGLYAIYRCCYSNKTESDDSNLNQTKLDELNQFIPNKS